MLPVQLRPVRLLLLVPLQTRTILQRNMKLTELTGKFFASPYSHVDADLTSSRRAAYGYDVNDPAFQQWQATQTGGGDAATTAQQPPAAA